MNCQNHTEVPAIAFCRACGKALCTECRRDANGTVFCQEHAPAAAPPTDPWTTPAPPPVTRLQYAGTPSPGWALALGLTIPGVGAIYNGQYAKGLVHAVVFGLLVSLLSADAGMEPLLGLMLTAWIFYMGFEAYHTALRRRRGEPVDEFSSIINMGGQHSNLPVAGITLIGLGVLLLLNTLDLINFRVIARYWPVLLIAAGAWLLWVRVSGAEGRAGVRHER